MDDSSSMSDLFSSFWLLLSEFFNSDLGRSCLSVLLFSFPFFMLSSMFRVLADFDFGLTSDLGSWLANKFIDLLKKWFGFEFIKKLGLARPGVDYVDCDTQDCEECPFRDTCPPERYAEFSEIDV